MIPDAHQNDPDAAALGRRALRKRALRKRALRKRALRRRALLNTVNLTTPLGLLVARAGRARVRRGPDGLWLAEGYRLRLPIAGAFTVGNVITTSSTFDQLLTEAPDVLAHEEGHSCQYAALGLLFFPLYTAASAWSWVRYRSPALGNVFERRAGLVAGNYLASNQPLPEPRPIRAVLTGVGRSPISAVLTEIGRIRPRPRS